MKARYIALMMAGLAGLFGFEPARAIAIGFSPASSSVVLGDSVAVNVVVSGLRASATSEVVSAFDLDVLYDANVLAATRFDFDAALGAIGVDAFADATLSAGRVDFANVSLLDLPSLFGLQSDQVVLGQLVFDAIGIGRSFLTFDAVANAGALLAGADPLTPLALDSIGAGFIDVAGTVPVSEPAAGGLLLIALALAARMRRRCAARR